MSKNYSYWLRMSSTEVWPLLSLSGDVGVIDWVEGITDEGGGQIWMIQMMRVVQLERLTVWHWHSHYYALSTCFSLSTFYFSFKTLNVIQLLGAKGSKQKDAWRERKILFLWLTTGFEVDSKRSEERLSVREQLNTLVSTLVLKIAF